MTLLISGFAINQTRNEAEFVKLFQVLGILHTHSKAGKPNFINVNHKYIFYLFFTCVIYSPSFIQFHAVCYELINLYTHVIILTLFSL